MGTWNNSMTQAAARMCVLSSSSSGNCSVVVSGEGERRSVVLIDLGLSPRMTERLLMSVGVSLDEVDTILITHLDTDHLNPAWAGRVPGHVRVHMHAKHADRHACGGLNPWLVDAYEGDITTSCGLRVRTHFNPHDRDGSVCFRFDFNGSSLGFATDLGRVSEHLVQHLRGVDVLAIESNYCPVMQEASNRPWFLKRRIMGGSGHLSNDQCVEAIGKIAPKEHVVLLHLSRQCNSRELVAGLHAGARYGLTIARHDGVTDWIGIGGRAEGPANEVRITATIPHRSPCT